VEDAIIRAKDTGISHHISSPIYLLFYYNPYGLSSTSINLYIFNDINKLKYSSIGVGRVLFQVMVYMYHFSKFKGPIFPQGKSNLTRRVLKIHHTYSGDRKQEDTSVMS